MAKPRKSNGFMDRVAAFIVDKRNLFFLLYIFALLFSLESGELPWAAIAAAAAAILALAVWLLCRRRRPAQAEQQASEKV